MHESKSYLVTDSDKRMDAVALVYDFAQAGEAN